MATVKERMKVERWDYRAGKLLDKNLPGSPWSLLDSWFERALKKAGPHANAMTLSTVSSKGQPSSRVVLLRDYHPVSGLVFFSHYESQKARDLSRNNKASLAFFWGNLERQIIIEGKVQKVNARKSIEYFYSRPRDSQIAAAISDQSRPIRNREELEKKFAALKKECKDKEVPFPKNWGGYCLKPERFEFWQGRENRLNDRISYSKNRNRWSIQRLQP